MKKIKILCVIFDTEIKSYEIAAFRGAIIDKVGKSDSILFHQHLNSDNVLYRYPLIQYKQLHKKPAIICIEKGVDEIHKYFENRDWSIDISNRHIEMKIYKLQMNQFNIQVWNKKFKYQLWDWIALNQENYKTFIQTESMKEKIEKLEKILTGNILSFAKGIEWTIDKPIEVSITDLKNIKKLNLKGNPVMGFNIEFTTNVFIPDYIGLGKSPSFGFGTVKNIK